MNRSHSFILTIYLELIGYKILTSRIYDQTRKARQGSTARKIPKTDWCPGPKKITGRGVLSMFRSTNTQ